MARKTRKQANKAKGIFSIPELRRSFEHVEYFLFKKLKSNEPKSQIVKDVQAEWKKIFLKPLDKSSAEAYVDYVISRQSNRRKTLKKGGALPLSGSSLDHITRAGVYIQPAAIPPNAYGNIVDYVSKGFWNPEIAQQYDPVPGQTHYPTSVPVGMGDNTVQFGHKGGKRRTLRRGGASVPSGVIQDYQDMFYGKRLNMSPDQTQRPPHF
jgi:hypothetical protein